MTYQPGVDAIVANYRTPSDLDDFLRSWDAYRPSIPWELWVVNIDPTEDDRAVATAWAAKMGPRVHLVEYGFNCGFAHAINQASLGGSHETLLALNADIVLTENAIDDCCRELHAHPEWAVLGPRQVNDQGRITHAGIFGTMEKPAHRGWQQRDTGQYSEVSENAVMVSGSAMFVKRRIWDELRDCPRYRAAVPTTAGAMLPSGFYYEDTWVCYHAASHGYRVVYLGTTTIVHRWHKAVQAAQAEQWAAQMMKESHDLFRRVCDTHGVPHD